MSLANNSRFNRASIYAKDANECLRSVGRQMSWPNHPIELPSFSLCVINITKVDLAA